MHWGFFHPLYQLWDDCYKVIWIFVGSKNIVLKNGEIIENGQWLLKHPVILNEVKDLYNHHRVFQQISPAGRNDRDFLTCSFIYTLHEIFFAPLRLCEKIFWVCVLAKWLREYFINEKHCTLIENVVQEINRDNVTTSGVNVSCWLWVL